MMWGFGGPCSWGSGLFMWLIPALLVGLVVWPVTGGSRRKSDTDGALEILNGRLARGEINEAEYGRLKSLLR